MLGLQRIAGGIAKQLFRRAAYSSTGRANVTTSGQQGASATVTATDRKDIEEEPSNSPKNPLVAAAFENLKNEPAQGSGAMKAQDANSMEIDNRIIKAKTVNGLLSVSEASGAITRKHALKIVSILAEWSSKERVKISEFENDSRFLRLCRMLGRNNVKNNNNNANEASNTNKHENRRVSGFRTDDLNTVLGVAGDDEAAKLISSISMPQMVKVMSTLAQRRRRSTPLLRSLAFNISSSTDALDLKQCADVLYAMASLNFPDSVLAAKVCGDVQAVLPKNTQKSAVVGSILTSLGLLKYRDLDILESLTQWILQHHDICRPQDLSALFITSAILNFQSSEIEDVRKKLVNSIVKQDFRKAQDWLNHVWALTLLGLVENKQLETVLSTEFLNELKQDRSDLTPTLKMKLLNLNSYVSRLRKDYKGPVLSGDSDVFTVPIAHSKTKQVLLGSMIDALKSLLPASNHLQTQVDSKMGFLIDAFCVFDAKRNPLPLNKEHPNGIKVALMIIDFHDICHGTHRSVNGITKISLDLLESSGYKVIPVSYNEFSSSDKLLKRVQYLEGKFKTLISIKSEK